ncbi:SMP-30/gluconolactonase/LRE family protein [Nonomuraea wenchangensis]|uniref:SMP-30/gluconolactonase/LRE family protein n=1 Tax=Nonomuraea wenchangensis TaxID=568860 RepID=UPI0033233A68
MKSDGSVADGLSAPNGLVFSHDEKKLFVSDTRGGSIRVFDVRDDGTLTDGEVFAEAAARSGAKFDNLRLDEDGRLWAAAMGDGVHCYDPDGTHPHRPDRRPGAGRRYLLGRRQTRPPLHHGPDLGLLAPHGRHRHPSHRAGPPPLAVRCRSLDGRLGGVAAGDRLIDKTVRAVGHAGGASHQRRALRAISARSAASASAACCSASMRAS